MAAGDLPGSAATFHPDATWSHRNPDRLCEVHAGVDAIVAILAASFELTSGTLRPCPSRTWRTATGTLGC